MSFRLRVVPPKTEPYEVSVEDHSCTIGRSSGVELTIDDRAVSRRHARLYLDGQGLYLEDLQSNNGTWLEKIQVTSPVPIRVGQIIRLAAGQSDRGAAFEIHVLDAPGSNHEPQRLLERGIVKNALEVLKNASSFPQNYLSEEELRTYAERFYLLNGIHASLGGTVDESRLLDLILERVFAHLECDAGIIYLQNSEGILEQAARRTGQGYKHKPLHSQTLIHQLMEEGKALLFNDVMRETMFNHAQSLHHARVRSLLASPLMDNEGTLGMMVLYSRSTLGQFRMRDLEFLVQLAAVATLRIRNLRLADLAAKQLMDINRILQEQVEKRTRDLKDRNTELESLERIVYVLGREHEMEKVLNTVLDKGFDLFPKAERGSFLLWRDACECFDFAAVRGFDDLLEDITLTREEAVARYMAGHEVVEGVYLSHNYVNLPAADKFIHLDKPRTMMAMTVVVDDALMGFLIMGSKEQVILDPSDHDKLNRYRDHATAAVARAQLLRRLNKEHQERLAAERKALVQERMAMLGQLSGGVAHCINNANNPVKQGAAMLEDKLAGFRDFLFELLEEEGAEDFKKEFSARLVDLEEQLATVSKGSKRIEDFVKSLWLVFEVKESPGTEIDLGAHLDATISLLQGKYDTVAFEWERPDEPCLLTCSPSEFLRVISAVITNACDAIDARRNQEPLAPAGVKISLDVSEEAVCLKFQDTGVGIPEALMDQIFIPSFTTRPDIRLGMGLPSTRNIVQKLGGKIDVTSVEGQGTVISVHLPRQA